jgi:ABC-type amino acid transport substrate-binding protein
VIGTEGTFAPFSYHDDNDNLVGYDVEVSEALAKELAIDFLNKEIKKESWYKLTSKLNAIAINPISGNIDETGIVYWFRKGTP